MRPLLLLLLLVSIFQFPAAQDQNDPIIASQIDQQIWTPFKEAYATNDGPKYVSVHSPDVLRITKWGIKQNPLFSEDILKSFAQKNRKPVQIDFRFEHRIHSDSIAYEVGYYKVSGESEEGNPWLDYGRFHVVLKKEKGIWKITQDWDTGNVNGTVVGASDFQRLDSLDHLHRITLDSLVLEKQTVHVLKKEGNEIFQYWEFENHPALWKNKLGDVPALQMYKDSLKERLGEETFWATIANERTQIHNSNNKNTKDNLDNYQLVHQGGLGSIRPISFLEAEILNYQLNRYPLLGHPTEFHGFIAQNEELGLVRAYFAASDQPWPPKPRAVIEQLKNDLKNGWRLTKHLHNHYEPAENNYLGVMAPSKPDAHYFKILRDGYGLEEALITNGFTTVVLKPEELDLLNSD